MWVIVLLFIVSGLAVVAITKTLFLFRLRSMIIRRVSAPNMGDKLHLREILVFFVDVCYHQQKRYQHSFHIGMLILPRPKHLTTIVEEFPRTKIDISPQQQKLSTCGSYVSYDNFLWFCSRLSNPFSNPSAAIPRRRVNWNTCPSSLEKPT